MLRLIQSDFQHLHKFIYNTKGNIPTVKNPPCWLTKLQKVFSAVERHPNWISTLSNTTASIEKIRGYQTVLIAERDYLTAIGVSQDYQTLNSNEQQPQKQQQMDSGE